ncbi:MAG: carbon monoxide dehydrogenase subunit G [Gemmatimonadetes bacterium]|nr:carbon monoxide dehydrogenase subunit G [Gemmatimonadota bacterium]
MIIEGTFPFAAPREVVWELLQDPAVLAQAIPGAKRLDRVEDDRFEGEMHVSVGPVSAAAFSVTVTISDKVSPERFTMTIEGKGPLGFTRGTARVELHDRDGGTLMKYRADLKIGGKIAGVGQRMLDSVSRTMTRQGLEALNREVQNRLAGISVGATSRSPAVRWKLSMVLLLLAIVVLILILRLA